MTNVRLSEATLSYPTAFQGEEEEVTLWDPGQQYGVGEWLQGEDTEAVFQLVCESGLHWDHGPYRKRVLEAIEESEDPKESIQDPEIAQALDQWRAGQEKGLDYGEDTALIETYFGEEEDHTAYREASDKGEFLLKKLGWTGGSLGCRNTGITEPIIADGMVSGRAGVGYNHEEILLPYEGEEITDTMEVTCVGNNYGTGVCSRGTVFIPRGALKHMENIFYQNGTLENLIGRNFVCELIAGSGKHPWRLKKVLEIDMTWSEIE